MATRNRGSIYSFGDDGLTASVSASGRLLRVSRHFSGQDFGYCVDHPSIQEPYFVFDRITSLHSMASDSGDSLGIDPTVDILDNGNEPSAEFVHDRWPHFTIQGSNCEIKLQFFASGGTIYQTYEFSFDGADVQPPKLVTMADLLIRQLDFIDSANKFNEADIQSAGYETRLAGKKTRIERSHHVDEGEVVLFILAYCEGELLTFQHDEEKEVKEGGNGRENGENSLAEETREEQGDNNGGKKTFGMVWSDKVLEDLPTTKSLKVTFAYRLEFLEKRDERDKYISRLDAEAVGTTVQQVDKDPFEEHRFTDNGDINLALRRNLEHILSVCSVPVIAQGDESGKLEPAIALTCGDIDGHRVATAASFYYFEFLLLALDYFESFQRPCKSDYTYWMTERILRTCKGHLKWLFGKEYRNVPENPSAPHCWVSGNVIDEWEKNPYLPSKSLVEVLFQIIKAGDFYARHKEWEVPKEVGVAVQAWIKELDQRNKLGCYAFPRYSNEPTHSFYFTDHVFIWRAIKSAESLGFKSMLNISIPTDGDEGDGQPTKKSTKSRNYSSIQIQNQILKRFTTENPISKKRMIAVSRSPAHNRFLLRSKDSGLFQAMDLGLFDKPGAEKGDGIWKNKIDTWRNLVDAQVSHEDNDDTTWDEPMRFALAFIMSQAGKCMNRLSQDEMRTHAMSVLIQSTWSSGLFPGQLDANKEPVLYDDEVLRDTYWAFSFEIPYIIWKYSRPASIGHDVSRMRTDGTKTNEAKADTELLKLLQELLESQTAAKGSNKPTIYSMKHSFPFNNVVDQKNIVELSDEWLYNEPDFFAHVSTSGESPSPPPSDEESSTAYFSIDQHHWQRLAVVDVPRRRDTKKKSLSVEDLITVLEKPTDLQAFMQQKRFPSKAKKRFCASFSSRPELNRAYHQTPSEEPAMEAFSERHISYDKFFAEVTAAELNKWTTELHLSFYALDRKRSSNSPATIQKIPFSFQTLSGDGGARRLARIAMSFRFDGDFFDRYWTCHFLEFDRQMASDFDIEDELKALLLPKGPGVSTEKKEPWRQRRVLELLLFDRIMRRMQGCTADILKDARLNAWKKPARSNSKEQEDIDGTESSLGRSLDIDYDAFRTTSSRCQEYQQLLQTVEQDLHENLAKIELWLNREKERVAERPRWTFNDESRYRGVISKLLFTNQHRIQELTRSHASISNFNDSLTKKLEVIRSDLDQRRADDIKRFTYVTVVFLPLGFATGIFSMSDAPAGRTLISMVVTAVVALVTTALLLKCAEPLETLYNWGSRGIHRLTAGLRRGKPSRDKAEGAAESV
ncbi:hypothetical protein CEP53_000091 [Fusarium sp. AF-6]|nr:hypothetical protein CEP53_000091 [Fusarium sp. AF-6]